MQQDRRLVDYGLQREIPKCLLSSALCYLWLSVEDSVGAYERKGTGVADH